VTDVVGYSGHDTGIAIPLAAYVMGARIIEKHFTLDRSAKGTDHAMSLEPQGLRTLVENLKKVHAAMGQREPIVYDEEQPALAKMRRRL
jgi:N-acetylneuraminate synthase/sialic acid synthase